MGRSSPERTFRKPNFKLFGYNNNTLALSALIQPQPKLCKLNTKTINNPNIWFFVIFFRKRFRFWKRWERKTMGVGVGAVEVEPGFTKRT
jgi:hypothetical protein